MKLAMTIVAILVGVPVLFLAALASETASAEDGIVLRRPIVDLNLEEEDAEVVASDPTSTLYIRIVDYKAMICGAEGQTVDEFVGALMRSLSAQRSDAGLEPEVPDNPYGGISLDAPSISDPLDPLRNSQFRQAPVGGADDRAQGSGSDEPTIVESQWGFFYDGSELIVTRTSWWSDNSLGYAEYHRDDNGRLRLTYAWAASFDGQVFLQWGTPSDSPEVVRYGYDFSGQPLRVSPQDADNEMPCPDGDCGGGGFSSGPRDPITGEPLGAPSVGSDLVGVVDPSPGDTSSGGAMPYTGGTLDDVANYGPDGGPVPRLPGDDPCFELPLDVQAMLMGVIDPAPEGEEIPQGLTELANAYLEAIEAVQTGVQTTPQASVQTSMQTTSLAQAQTTFSLSSRR